MAMDAKDLRIESALGAHSDDGNTKYAQSGTAFQTNGNKPYHDIGSNSLAKVDVPTARPCAIIGPDRVVPPPSTNDAFVKKAPVEPWPCTDGIYQHPPEYPHKSTEYQMSRNISPRQTFQENMQRIMVPPSYASVKNNEDHCLKNSKLIPIETKFCDVPYSISPINNEPKIVKSSEGLVLNNNSNQSVLPHGWASSGVNVRPLRPYGAPDLYQYSEYSNCPAPRPISMIRPHRNIHEDMPQAYQDRYHEANIRFKPYSTTKERPLQNPHSRYDYIPNYPNAFQPHPSFPPHKYELQKSIPTHPYSVYPPVPMKYLERRMPLPTMEKYPRSPSQQVNFNQPFCNPNIPPSYGTLPATCLQNRAHPYAPDPSTKSMIQNRLYFDSSNARKFYTNSENMFINDINRPSTLKSDLMYPSYPPINVHSFPPHHMYRKESSMKGYEHGIHYRNIEYSTNINPLGRLPLQFSPQTMSISPSDSITSNDTTQILGNVQDDCGYASQSSTASIRSTESGVNRITNDIYRRQDMMLPQINKFGQKLDTSTSSKDKKGLNVRQFLQMWNEGDDEGNDNNRETTKQKDSGNPLGRYESANQEQLYVLGLVNVPKEELGKYDHIQKISKLPENIKGYNSIELLNQYEKLVESPGLNNFSLTPPKPQQKDLHVPSKNSFPRNGADMSNNTRPLSPLDVEAKISQSVIHKEVGCNFEIRPCSPQMMNVELATPVHNLLGERLIEKVVNPMKTKSPICQRIGETTISSSISSPKVPSCKMVSNQYPSHVNDSLKTNYCLQDLESNSGVCLASLPRLDNDIELNFPEINQQFINDNKMSSIRDLPLLDSEIGENTHKSQNIVNNQPFNIVHLNSAPDSDKDVSKLSKYRKQKRNSVPHDIDDTLNIPLNRKDSVIIKNPENVKSQDEDMNNAPLINNNGIENIINSTIIMNKNYGTVHETLNDYKSMDSDTAIDFSLNKCDDLQGTGINDTKSVSDALKHNIALDKNIYMNNEIINNNTDKFYSKKLPKQLKETVACDNFSLVEPKSPTLINITSSKGLNNNVVLESLNEGNQVLQPHDTVITHSKSKEILSDISLVNIPSLSEEIVSQNNLPSLSLDSENTSTNITDNITAINKDIEQQAINYCLAEYSGNVSFPICELKYNLASKNEKCHEIIKDRDVESNLCSQREEHNILTQKDIAKSHPQTHSVTNTENNSPNNLAIQKSKDEEIQGMAIGSEGNEDMLNMMFKDKNEIRSSEQSSKDIDLKSDNYVNNPNTSSNEDIGKELLKVNNLDETEPSHSNDIIPMSINDFDSTSIPSTEMDIFKNDESLSKTKNNIISDDMMNDAEISPALFNENSRSKIIYCEAESTQVRYEFTFNKELFSSRVQNLLIYNEGSYTSIPSYGNENIEDISHIFCRNGNDFQTVKEDSKDFIKPHFEEKIVHLEFENNTNTHIISRKNDETTSNIELDNSTKFVENETPTVASNHCDPNTIVGVVDKIQQNVIMTGENKDKVVSEGLVMKNCDSESLFEVAEEKINNTVPENNKDNNHKINNHIEGKNALPVIWNQLPNKPKRTLKRSLSESAVTDYNSATINIRGSYDNNFVCDRKRAKMVDSEILVENFTTFIQSNRRNSVSTIYNDENVSFCIFIDNDCVLTEENESCQKICYTEIPDECLTTICTEEDALNPDLTEDISYGDAVDICGEEGAVDSEFSENIYYGDDSLTCEKEDNIHSELNGENIPYEEPEEHQSENDLIIQNMEDRTVETWVEDVAYIETVFSDDIAEDIIISAPSSPKDSSEDENGNSNFIYNVNENEHTNKVKHIYGNQMCDDDAELVEKLYRTPQMNVNKTLIDRESQHSQEYNRYYDNESLEKVLSEANTLDTYSLLLQNDSVPGKSLLLPRAVKSDDVRGNKENLKEFFPDHETRNEIYSTVDLPDLVQPKLSEEKNSKEYDDCLVHSCESSCDNLMSYKREEKLQYAISSSPEVSSTTSEEKGPSILLKIRSYKGSKISEVNEMSANYKHTNSQRPLITKAAQKYIPPLKETVHDLKVKIRLPKQSLYKLQQLKKSKEKPKIHTNCSKLFIKSFPEDNPKKAKPKPKFEDVLMSIDEIQFKKHKAKNKKNKQSVPKVIIKKNENGAHYASTQTKEIFNPDLTGRKWQPWVFLEKSNFVDKMALKQKFKAVYSHRKKTFVLAENFRKYKSISNAKFVISHPKSNDISTGNLKYTFRLKHS